MLFKPTLFSFMSPVCAKKTSFSVPLRGALEFSPPHPLIQCCLGSLKGHCRKTTFFLHAPSHANMQQLWNGGRGGVAWHAVEGKIKNDVFFAHTGPARNPSYVPVRRTSPFPVIRACSFALLPCRHICMCECMSVWMYECMNVCMYVYICGNVGMWE